MTSLSDRLKSMAMQKISGKKASLLIVDDPAAEYDPLNELTIDHVDSSNWFKATEATTTDKSMTQADYDAIKDMVDKEHAKMGNAAFQSMYQNQPITAQQSMARMQQNQIDAATQSANMQANIIAQQAAALGPQQPPPQPNAVQVRAADPLPYKALAEAVGLPTDMEMPSNREILNKAIKHIQEQKQNLDTMRWIIETGDIKGPTGTDVILKKDTPS